MAKNISAAVGMGGANLFYDTVTVQYLLNCVPATKGGPLEELDIDGIIGPKTLAAIRRFQEVAITRADGRVDPGGPTIAALGAYDPMPWSPISEGLNKGVKGNFSEGYKGDFPFAKSGKGDFADLFSGKGKNVDYDPWGKGGKAGFYDSIGKGDIHF